MATLTTRVLPLPDFRSTLLRVLYIATIPKALLHILELRRRQLVPTVFVFIPESVYSAGLRVFDITLHPNVETTFNPATTALALPADMVRPRSEVAQL